MHFSYQRRLKKLAATLPSAARLLRAVCAADKQSQYRMFGDTVIRCAVQHAQKQIATGTPFGLPLDQCETIFDEGARLLAIPHKSAPLGNELGERYRAAPYCGWIWRNDRAEDVFSKGLKYLVENNFHEPLYTLAPEEFRVFQKGVELLESLLPRSAQNALSHVHLIVFFAADTNATPASSSEYRLVGSIYLSRRLLRSPWWVAEHLYHEALHQQLYDFRAGHSLLSPEAQREDAPRVCSLWNAPDSSRGNYWDVHRALAAFHVYVHLALMATVAERQAPLERNRLEAAYGPNRMVSSRTACARAQYLLEQLRLPVFWNELGRAGQRLTDWFASVLELIDSSPPPAGAYVHLLVDRFWREAREAEILLHQTTPSGEICARLGELASAEGSEFQNIFEMSGRVNVDQYRSDLEQLSKHDPVTKFISTRDTIIRHLPDGYSLCNSPEPDEKLRSLIEQSSESLRIAFGR